MAAVLDLCRRRSELSARRGASAKDAGDAAGVGERPGAAAEIVFLPCIRREPLPAAISREAASPFGADVRTPA